MTPNTRLPYQILSQSDYQRMPWKNGLGETLEIQRHEDRNGLRFRISQASVVEDGVFSDFSGLHRTLVLLSGEGMMLTHRRINTPPYSHRLTQPLDIARFAGGDKTHATLIKGAIEDLNIMVREADTQANVEVVKAPYSITLPTNKHTVFCGIYVGEDSVVEKDNGDLLLLKAHSIMLLSKDTHLTLTQGRGIFITILDV